MFPGPSSASFYVKFSFLINRFTFNKDEMDEKPALPVRSPPVKKKSNSSPAPKTSATSASVSHVKPGKPKTSEESPEIKSPSVSCSRVFPPALPYIVTYLGRSACYFDIFSFDYFDIFSLRVTVVKIVYGTKRPWFRFIIGSQTASHLFV
jgi:hypothetical protein